MPDSSQLVFSRLHLPRPLEPSAVSAFLTRLASERDAPRVALELRADQEGVRHLLGCRPTDIHRLRRLLADLIPGSLLTKLKGGARARGDVEVATRLRLQPGGLPLRTDEPEATTRSLLSAMAAPLKLGEVAVLQVVLGPHVTPRPVPRGALEPGLSLAQALTGGERPASPETRLRLRERLSQAGFAVTVRIGAGSPDRGRRRRFIMNVLGALSTAQSPGVQLDLERQPAKQLNDAALPWRWPLHLSVAELVGILGWPIGDDDLPGLPPAHPKPLRPAAAVHTGKRVFAASAAPGDDRLVGIAPADQTFHAVAYGPSGSGKTNVLLHLILADIKAGRPVAVLDPKKQLVEDILARVPKERIKDVVILDAADQPTAGFNPLDVAGRDPDVVVDGILAVFEAVFADGWGPRTADIFSAALRTLARASTPDHPATTIDVVRILTDARFRRQQVAKVQGDLALDGFWTWYEALSPQAQASAIAAPLNKLRQFLLRPAVVRMLGQRSGKFRLRDMFRENKIVLMPVNEGLVGAGTASLLGSLAVAEIWQATQERAQEKDPAQRPGMVVVDEAPRFLHLPTSLADALAVSRSLAVGWVLAAQFRSQFPPALRSAVDMNARSKIVFATEYEDARDTAKLTRDLTADDFLGLPKFHAYANLVANGHPSGWALIKTLPPPAATTDPAVVRAASRANYAATTEDAESPEEEATAMPTTDPTNQATNPAEAPGKTTRPHSKRRSASVATATPVVAEQVGRKRRQP
ncbi:hypothetical protein GCM10027059_41770 [Myceligenerans halotolerans]